MHIAGRGAADIDLKFADGTTWDAGTKILILDPVAGKNLGEID